MTKQITKKAVRESYSRVLSIGYGGLDNALRCETRRWYTAGVYGWNADVYVIDGVAIVTGSRAFGDKVPYQLIEKYEKKAEALGEEYRQKKFYTGLFEDEKQELRSLLQDFIKEAVQE